MAPGDTRRSTIAASQRWQRLIPLAFVTYSLAYLDRSNHSIGVAGGLADDLGLGASASAPLGAPIPEFLPQSVSGAAMALVNSAGAFGGFLGAYVVGWLQGGLGNGAAYAFMAVTLFLSALAVFGVRTRGGHGLGPAVARRRERAA